MPLILLGLGIIGFTFLVYSLFRMCSKPCRRKRKMIINILCVAPLFILIFAICLPLALAAAAFCTAIFVLPGYVIHIYSFLRSMYWWRSNRYKANKTLDNES